MKYAYYPGCSLHGPAKQYDTSVKFVCQNLGIDLWEVPDWTCCGASSAHSFSHLLGLAIPASTLIPAEKEGLDIVVPCAACWQRLVWVNHEVTTNPETRKKINQAIEYELTGSSKVLTIMEAIKNVSPEKISQTIKRSLKGLKIAAYYGCYYVKPPKVAHADHPERPRTIDDIMTMFGAEALDWPFKTECCGASLGFADFNTPLAMTQKVLEQAVKSGADMIVTACPLCHQNLDMQQSTVNKKFGTNYNIPVVYFTQMLSYAMGMDPKTVGMHKNFTAYESVISKLG